MSGEGEVSGYDVNFTLYDIVNSNNIYVIGVIIDQEHMVGTWSEDGPDIATWRAERL